VSLWWLSFADGTRPDGDQLLGIAIVEAADLGTAIKASWALDCNPGGEVKGMWCDPAMVERLSFSLPVGKLLGPTEARALANRIGEDLDS